MVCQRCVLAIEQITTQQKLPVRKIELGEVFFHEPLTANQINLFKNAIEAIGFELLQDQENILVDKIKQNLIQYYAAENDEKFVIGFKEYLEQKIGIEIAKLNEVYFKHKSKTIEQLAIELRIEKVKELLIYNDLSLKEIAFQLNYSSVPYLSKQFKNIVGVPPKVFKTATKNNRKGLDEL
ncbi:helix-turn-helix domain-containing protein [Flavobacterium agricola]|uniref:Helix-turn-helix domain-containing protein n=1 Tax=Flavobacterium agricola TaxID=2870839 RepID=A0ABY6LWR0_9FLAO|nr:helix-turn-helix domain-containing protein [Flavobacterium agricola]UYW00701.1 helix-turn-helix domain-containing protein [Flavobacterium agricola]